MIETLVAELDTPLAQHLKRRIAQQGPVTVSEFMALALADPEHGYYRVGQPLGRVGDFITAPEISQMFGELIGLWMVDSWQRLGEPDRLLLVELGPGRGTLLADALRAAGLAPAFLAALEIHLVEISTKLREQQRRSLAGFDLNWHDDISTLPDGPLLVLANEFFDALPVRQFVRGEAGWCERVVALDETGALTFGLTGTSALAERLLPENLKQAAAGTLFESAPAAISLVTSLAQRLAVQSGAALIIDYGRAERGAGWSLQAVRDHRKVDPLDSPGLADLSAHLDFAAVATAAAEVSDQLMVQGPVEQGRFLQTLGIETRAQTLMQTADPQHAAEIQSALIRLTDAEAMGSLFKALALCHKSCGPLAGFDEEQTC